MLEQWRDPVFNDRHAEVPVALAARLTEMANQVAGRHIYYERMHALLAVAGAARLATPAALPPDGPRSDCEREFGAVLGQALHEGCELADVALAAGLPPEQIVAIGRRTLRGTNWPEGL